MKTGASYDHSAPVEPPASGHDMNTLILSPLRRMGVTQQSLWGQGVILGEIKPNTPIQIAPSLPIELMGHSMNGS